MLKVENNLGWFGSPPISLPLRSLPLPAISPPGLAILLHLIHLVVPSPPLPISSLLPPLSLFSSPPKSDQMLAISWLLTYLHFCNHGSAWIFMPLVSRCGASAYTACLFDVCLSASFPWHRVCIHSCILCVPQPYISSVYFCQQAVNSWCVWLCVKQYCTSFLLSVKEREDADEESQSLFYED